MREKDRTLFRHSYLMLCCFRTWLTPEIAIDIPGKFDLDDLARSHQTLKSGGQSGNRNLEILCQTGRIGVDSLREIDLEKLVEGLVQRQTLCSGNLVGILFAHQRMVHGIALGEKDFSQQQVCLQFFYGL